MKQGYCPKCGGNNLSYGLSYPDGNQMRYEVDCDDCEWTGYEWYELKFIEYSER